MDHSEIQQEIAEKLSCYSLQAGQEEEVKAAYKGSRIKDFFPTNYYEQKQLFFERKKLYNPYFTYKGIVSPQARQVHRQYKQIAHKILLNNTFKPSDLPILNEEQVLQTIKKYLQTIGLEDYIEVMFEPDCLSRTSVVYYKSRIVLKIRLPLSYNRINLQGVLNHQVGTHIVRYLNHKENSQRKPSEKSKVFQEGLAAINQLLPEQRPFLFKAALRYCAAIEASTSSFVQVYAFISKYISDQQDCWRETVRTKRGCSNSDKSGAYCKDQNYLIGAVEILKNRHNIDLVKCFYSKLSAEEGKNINNGVLPPFLHTQDKQKIYMKKIQAIAICNFIDDLDEQIFLLKQSYHNNICI